MGGRTRSCSMWVVRVKPTGYDRYIFRIYVLPQIDTCLWAVGLGRKGHYGVEMCLSGHVKCIMHERIRAMLDAGDAPSTGAPATAEGRRTQ